jgi:hypothetical protein
MAEGESPTRRPRLERVQTPKARQLSVWQPIAMLSDTEEVIEVDSGPTAPIKRTEINGSSCEHSVATKVLTMAAKAERLVATTTPRRHKRRGRALVHRSGP